MVNVIHIKNKLGATNEVYIGRGSKWGNPYKIGVDGNRQEVIAKYRVYLAKHPTLSNHFNELVGKTLVCYCKPKACHGDVLVEYVETMEKVND